MFLITLTGFSQLDKEHFIPPVYPSTHGWLYPNDQVVYLSTPTKTPFNYSILDGAGNVLQTGQVSNAIPISYKMYAFASDFVVKDADLNKVLTDRGIHIVADEKVYCNLRANAGGGARPNATSMTAKGKAALGKAFRIGHFPSPQNFNDAQNSLATKSSTVGIYATKNNTNISIDLTTRKPVLRGTGAPSTANVINITLNKGETYVIAIKNSDSNLNKNTGMIGGLVTSDKDIVINCGSWGGNLANKNVVDIGLDQIVGADKIGTEYAVVRGALTRNNPGHEMVMIVAHEANTQVKVNGIVVTTIAKAGGFYKIPASKYSSQGAMYIETSVPAYAYQFMMGANDYNYKTQGMNFLPPISCRTTNFVDNIPFVEKIGGKTYGGAISIVTTKGATLTVTANGVSKNIGNPVAVPASNYEQYKISGLKGNVAVYSNTIALVSIVGQNAAAGYGGFFSGFVDNEIDDAVNCLPGYIFEPSGRYQTYQWFKDGIKIPGAINDSLFATETGEYTFEYTLASCKDTSDTIFAVALNKFELNGDTAFCPGDSAELSIIGSGFDSISWASGEQTASIFIKSYGSTDVRIYSDVSKECYVDTSVITTATICPVELIKGDSITICRGDTGLIQAIDLNNPTWIGDSLLNINDSTVRVYPIQTTTYHVERLLTRGDLLINNDFENVNLPGTNAQLDASLVHGWNTTATDNKIEIWRDGFLGHPAYSGTFFAELNATQPSALYQDIVTVPGETIKWGFAHRGRNGNETMQFKVGPTGGNYVTIDNYTDGPNAWGYYSGYYIVPAGQLLTRFLFSAVDPNAAANLIDAATFEAFYNQKDSVVVVVKNCNTDLEVTKTDGVPMYERSTNTIYTIVAKNNGPADIINATVSDPIPNGINNFSWSASFHGTASNSAGNFGGGAIADIVNLAVGDSIVYTVTAAVSGAKYGDLVNTATINTPFGIEDLDSTNNVAIDLDIDPDPTSCFIMMTDFEDYVNCTPPSYDHFTQAYAGNSSWVNSNLTAGIFINDPGNCSNIPNGHILPHVDGGTAYAGLHSPLSGNANKQEVIIGQLPTNLFANQEYEISFIGVSLLVRNEAKWNNFGKVDFFGIANGTSPVLNGATQQNWTTISAIPQVDHLGTSATIASRTKWNEYSFKFTPTRDLDRLLLAPRGNWAYVGIDNIIVKVATQIIELDTIKICEGTLNTIIPYAITSGTSDEYTIDWDNAANAAGILDVVQTTLPLDSQFVLSGLGAVPSGSYTAEINIYNTQLGCSGIDSILFIVNPNPDVKLRTDTAFCEGGNIKIDAGLFDSWKWNVGGKTAQAINVDSTYEYKVVVTNIFNCSDSDSVVITVNPLPIVALRNDTTICFGDSLDLDAKNLSASYLWNTSETTQTLKIGTAGTYEVAVKDTNTCVTIDEMTLNIHALPVVKLKNDTIVCYPEVVTVHAGIWDSYLWSNGSTANQVTLTTTDTLHVDIIDANGCTGSDTIGIQVIALPIVDLNNDTAICDGESVTLDAQNFGLNYNWNTTETTQTISINKAGLFGLEVTNQYGCLGSDSMELKIYALPIVFIGNDTIICESESVTINAGNWSSYFWNTGDNKKKLIIDSTSKVYVSIKDANGCDGSDTVNIKVNPVPVVNLGNDSVICSNQTVKLNAENIGWNYLWNSGETAQEINVKEGFFKVTVSDSIGCKGTDSVTVVIDLIPDPFPKKQFEICEGDNIDLEPDIGFGNFDINWPGLSISSILNVYEGGDYYSAVSSNYCTDTFKLTVAKIDTPNISIVNLRGKNTVCFNFEKINLTILDTDLTKSTYEWSTGETTANIEVIEEGNYFVTAYNILCKSIKSINVKEYCISKLSIPNAFTPNSEGPNDIFIPVPYGDITNYELLIFDRWGEQIFSTKNLNEGWDGTYLGNTCQVDVYVYKAIYDYITENQAVKTEVRVGTVTLLR